MIQELVQGVVYYLSFINQGSQELLLGYFLPDEVLGYVLVALDQHLFGLVC